MGEDKEKSCYLFRYIFKPYWEDQTWYFFFCFLQKYYGRKSPVGRNVCRLRKAYYNARHEASAQIDEIVGETASEADSSETSVSEKESGHEKDDDVIRCICGLYKDEGLMIQCDKCMVRVRRGSRSLVLMSTVTISKEATHASWLDLAGFLQTLILPWFLLSLTFHHIVFLLFYLTLSLYLSSSSSCLFHFPLHTSHII